MSKTIEAESVSVRYGQFLAVEDVSMRIEKNSVTAFIGPSGCGKTTFLRSINRMIETIPGVESTPHPDERRRHLGRGHRSGGGASRRRNGVPASNPFPTMSIFDNVVAGLRLNGERNKATLQEVAGKHCVGRTCGPR